MKRFCLAIAITAHCAGVDAGNYDYESYIGASAGSMTMSILGADQDASIQPVYARTGAKWGDFVAFELRVGTAFGEDTLLVNEQQTTLSLDNFYGGYFRFGCPLGTRWFPHLVVGYSHLSTDLETSGTLMSATDTGYSLGLGVDWKFHRRLGLNLEYTRYIDVDGLELTGPSLGLVHSF